MVGFVNARRLTDPLLEHAYHPVIEALTAIAAGLNQSGYPLDPLNSRLKRYKELHRQLTERFGPREATAVASILQIGIGAIRAGAAVFPIAKPLEAFLTPELASQVSKAIAQHRRASDRELLRAPVPYLSARLVEGISLLSKQKRIVLVFDEFELSPPQIDSWLRELTNHAYGRLDTGLLLIVAGRDPLGQDWIARGDSGGPDRLKHLPLDRFSREEVIEYVHSYIEDVETSLAKRIADSLSPAYRLPLVLRLLVSEPRSFLEIGEPAGPARLGRLTTELSDRLLDERRTTADQRNATLAVSTARSFDQSIVRELLDECGIPSPDEYFRWLERQYFINPNAPAYSFYDLVRDVLRTKLGNDDLALRNRLHQRLLRYYERAADSNDTAERVSKMVIEIAYHRLSLISANVLPEALGMLFQALPNGYQYTPHWSRMFGQVAAERAELGNGDRASLTRLAGVLDASWRQSTPQTQTGSGFVFDPAMNVFFTSFHQGVAPKMEASNAELWLSYFECRVISGSRFTTQLRSATMELQRIWDEAAILEELRAPDRLLRFCAAFDLSDAYNRVGDIAAALAWSTRALEIARLDQSPMREAFALVLMSANLKRQGAYSAALTNIQAAIDLVRRQNNPASSYYLGRFLLDKGVTYTYLAQSAQAEEAFESSRAHFRDISPQSIAELSHRIGWLKRVRGDLDGALLDHDLAVRQFTDLESGLPLKPTDGASSLQYLRAKALHSRGNVLRDMCQHRQAIENFNLAIDVFRREGGIRLEAIARKDRAWSFFQVTGYSAGQGDLMRALGDLGEATDRAEAAPHSATHRVEGLLDLCRIRICGGDLDGAADALSRAEIIASADADDPQLEIRCTLTRSLLYASRGDEAPIASWLDQVEAYAARADPPLWHLAAECEVVRAVLRNGAGDSASAATHLERAQRHAALWNGYGVAAVEELWMSLTRIRFTRPSPSNSHGELLDIYDEHEQLLGQATSKLAHKTGLWHRSFHAWVIGRQADGTKFVLLQQRGHIKRDFPGFLDISAAGHYRAGEGIEGGVREFNEELGIEVDPGSLTPVARRIVNEALDNGVVNREFQDIYALIGIPGLDQYTIGYPEVTGIFQCDIERLRQILDGTLSFLDCTGLEHDPDKGSTRVVERTIRLGDLIPSARHYLTAILTCLSGFLDEGLVGSDLRTQLPDGSYWKAS